MPVFFKIQKRSSQGPEIEPDHFDEHWQLMRMLSHQMGESPRGLTVHDEGELLNSRIDSLGVNDYPVITAQAPWPLISDFLTVEPPKTFKLSFLRRQKTSRTRWSEEPRGTLNVERLLANKPCFADPHPEQRGKKQHILFHDWSALGWDMNKERQVKGLADELLQEGYPLYAFHAGELIRVESAEALVGLLKEDQVARPEDELIQAAARKKITRDMLHIIDYHQLNALIDGSKAQDKTLETGDWWHHLKPNERHRLSASLKEAKGSFDSINCTAFPDDISMTRELAGALNLSKVTWHFLALHLSPGDLDALTLHETLTRRDITFNADDCAGIESLTVHHCEEALILPEGFPALLQKFRSLKRLGLEKAQNTACLQSMHFELSCETLNLAGSDIDNKTLETLIRNTPNLKHLALENCERLDWETLDFTVLANLQSLSLDSRANLEALTHAAKRLNRLNLLVLEETGFPANCLKGIETLCLSGAVEAQSLETLLKNAPKLSTLDVARLDIRGVLSAPLSLPTLEMLFLQKSTISSQNLSALLQKAPHLTHLNLEGSGNLSGELSCGTLPALKELKLKGSAITSRSLSALLANAPHLRRLYLGECRDIHAEISCNSLAALEDLDLEGSTITSRSLTALLANATQLKTLNLHRCYHIMDDITCGRLPVLEALNLEFSNITSQSLSALLKNAPQLKTVNLSKCRKLSDAISCGALLALEALNLEDSTINGQSLSALLKNAPRLKTLNLSRCINLLDVISCGALLALEALNLERSSINGQSLSALLANAPKLKTLNLGNCRELSDAISCGALLALEALNLENSAITGQGLSALLANPPRLKKLDLGYCKNLSDAISCGALLALEALNLERSAITGQGLSALLANAPQLKTLRLDGCNNLSDTISCGALLALEALNLENSAITGQGLSALLANAPQLKTLDLHHCTNLYNTISCGALPALEALDLASSTITGQSLSALLANAPQLKRLRLDGCKNLSDTISCGALPVLEALNLASSTITGQSLSALLANAPQLKRLRLDGCKNLYNITKLGTCVALEEVDLSYTHISSQNLTALLSHAPRLKSLTLGGCEDLFDTISCGSLPALESLSLYYSNLSSQSLINILQNAPNLKTLDLHYCPQFSKDKLSPQLQALLRNREVTYPHPSASSSHSHASLPFYSDSSPHASSSTPATSEAPTRPPDNPVQHSEDMPADKRRTAKVETFDADTAPTNAPLKAQKIFYPLTPGGLEPAVSSYRLNVFDELRPRGKSCQIDRAFTLINNSREEDFQRVDCRRLQEPPTPHPSYRLRPAFRGTQELTVDAVWQPLASLHVDEQLIAVYTEPVNAGIEIAYSPQDNRHYVKGTTQAQTVRVHFVLQPGEPRPSLSLPKAVASLYEDIRHYGDGALENIGNDWSGKEYLNAIRQQKKGACRHRAVAFKAAMAEIAPDIPVRIITNNVHVFVEVCINGSWLKMDLGGYPAQLRIEEQAAPASTSEPPPPAAVSTARLDENGQEVSDKPPPPRPQVYEAMLATWNTIIPMRHGLQEYCQQKVRVDAPKKCLIELPSGTALTGLSHQLQTHCRNIHRPFFYIHSPDDLICQAPFVRINEDGRTGTPRNGPGGALSDFLHAAYTRDNPPIIIVNYSLFSADDIVRFNALLDKTRFADGVAVPKPAKIIGLVNTQNPDRYTGSDFYSRFGGQVETCPVDAERLKSAIVTPFTDEGPDDTDAISINLYQGFDWKERLLGRWRLQGNDLHFEEGALPRALASGKAITLENAPSDDPDFREFWQKARVQGHIQYPRGVLPFPETTVIALKEGYDWEALLQGVNYDTQFSQEGIVCNPQKVAELFRRYECRDASLFTLPGWLEAHKDKALHLNMTRALSEDAWAECLSMALRHGVRLYLHFPSAALMPDYFPFHRPAASSSAAASSSSAPAAGSTPANAPLPQWEPSMTAATAIITSTDPDATIAAVTEREPGQWRVVDISECHPGDLLGALKGGFDKDSGKFIFTEQTSALQRALDEGQSVLLTGTFSPELTDALAGLLFARAGGHAPGRLLLVTDNKATFAFTGQSEHRVTAEEKRARLHLKDTEQAVVGDLETTPFATLTARRDFIRHHPGQNPDKAWEGLNTLPGAVTLAPFQPDNSAIAARAFHAERLEAVERILSTSPFAFLTGLTGVGKTTFVREHLAKKHSVHHGEAALQDWITDTSDRLKILFIDEANLELRQWSQFEGLFHEPPTLLVKGELVTLSPKHRVVFAGNPVSYGDERSLASLFERHGKAIVFKPLPPACIYQEILKPVFPATMPEAEVMSLCSPILDVYQHVCEASTDEVRITPRELQMMALLLTNAHEPPSVERARHLARDIAGHALPPAESIRLEQRLQEPVRPENTYTLLDDAFLITPSRQPVARLMQNLLTLRHNRRTGSGLNEAQQYGGLGGVIFEGEPGVGKSDFARRFLRARGYQPGNINSDVFPKGDYYYEIPVSMGLEEKTNMLTKAFHAGAVVIIDEINSSPMMEKLLNGLLMGIGPDGERPETPGFMVIGTQNPVTMAGRQAQSSALARRMFTLAVPEYPATELEAILCTITGIGLSEAADMAAAFARQSAFAKTHQKKPAPCFRDVLNLAKRMARAHASAPASSMPHNSAQDPIAAAARALVQRHYHPFASNEWHQGNNWLGVSAENLREEPYTSGCEGLRDVALKRQILEVLAEALLRAETPEQYQDALNTLASSGALDILNTGKGFSSRLFHEKTSSSEAMSAIKEEVWGMKPWSASRSPGNT